MNGFTVIDNKAEELWNEGRIFPKNEAEYMSNLMKRMKGD